MKGAGGVDWNDAAVAAAAAGADIGCTGAAEGAGGVCTGAADGAGGVCTGVDAGDCDACAGAAPGIVSRGNAYPQLSQYFVITDTSFPQLGQNFVSDIYYLHEEKSAHAVSLSWQIGAHAEGVFIRTNLGLQEMYQHFLQTVILHEYFFRN